MTEHHHSHPQWVIPPMATTPEGPDGLGQAGPVAGPPQPAATGTPLRRWRRPGGRRRALVSAALGLGLLVGGGAAGTALAADGGPDGGFAEVADDAGGPLGPGDGPGPHN